MSQAVRAIIIGQDRKVLVMRRDKQSGDYYTLVGGRVNEGETQEQALVREVKEETGLDITKSRLVFVEEHPAPYNEQYIFLCESSPTDAITALEEGSEEAELNKYGFDTHEPLWVDVNSFSMLPFRTPQLQKAISEGLSKGFPDQPVKI